MQVSLKLDLMGTVRVTGEGRGFGILDRKREEEGYHFHANQNGIA
jgi:hypothetical protein